MGIREILMLVGLVIAVLDWWLTYFLAKQKERQFEQLKWTKIHVDSQFSELYGPEFGLLVENER